MRRLINKTFLYLYLYNQIIQAQTHSLETSSVYSKESFRIDGRYCNRCKLNLERTVNESKGIIKVEISYITNKITVQYDPNLTSKIDIYKKLRDSECKFLTVENIL